MCVCVKAKKGIAGEQICVLCACVWIDNNCENATTVGFCFVHLAKVMRGRAIPSTPPVPIYSNYMFMCECMCVFVIRLLDTSYVIFSSSFFFHNLKSSISLDGWLCYPNKSHMILVYKFGFD